MDQKTDDVLKVLIAKGKQTGSLTYDEVNQALPEGTSDGDRLAEILELLESHGINLIDEADAAETTTDSANIAEEVLAAEAEAAFEDTDGDGRHIDDPVRMYLTQMGEIPLLTREKEISLAQKIEVTRRRFRRKVLECDYALRNVFETLKRVMAGDLPFDRTIKVSQTENLEKDKILQRMPHNLRTLEPLMEHNVDDFNRLIDDRADAKLTDSDRELIRKRLKTRRRKTATLVEELSIRTQKVQPLMKKLEQISHRMDGLDASAQALKGNKAEKEQRANLEKELLDLMLITLEEPAELAQARLDHEAAVRRVRAGQARAFGGQPAARRVDRQEVPQPRPELPGPDPGGQHRPDAGRGQVRVPPRLQVLDLRDVVDSPGDHPRHRRPGPDDPHPGPHDRDDVEAAQRLQEAAPGDRAASRRSRRSPRRPASTFEEPEARPENLAAPDQPRPPVGESEDSYFGDFIEDDSVESPVNAATNEMLKDKIENVLKTLTYREREIIKLRYGLGDGYTYTLEEVGRIFKVTRERVRQIEAKAVRKLQHPVRSRQLEGFLDTWAKKPGP